MIRIRTIHPKETVAGERYLMVATAMEEGSIRTRPARLEVLGEDGKWTEVAFYEEESQ